MIDEPLELRAFLNGIPYEPMRTRLWAEARKAPWFPEYEKNLKRELIGYLSQGTVTVRFGGKTVVTIFGQLYRDGRDAYTVRDYTGTVVHFSFSDIVSIQENDIEVAIGT